MVPAFLMLGLIVNAGCGSKPDSEPAKTESKTGPGTPGTRTDFNTPTNATPAESPRPEPVPLVYELDPAKLNFPGGEVTGTVGGTPFKPSVLIEGEYLIFRTPAPGGLPDREVRLKVGFAPSPSPDVRKVTITPDMPEGQEVPEILLTIKDPETPLQLFPNGYALKLELGHRQNWKLPGRIYLCLPDKKKTLLAGAFEASYPRQPTEPPSPDDLPYIKGTVTLVGAPPKAKLRVGYTAFPSPDVSPPLGEAEIDLEDSSTPLRWTKDEHDKPRITTLIAGDWKSTPSRYEFDKLVPGKYLVFASLSPTSSAESYGPTVCKWVTVTPGAAVNLDLTIDVTQLGGIEVRVPVEAVKSVQLVPADEPGAPPIDRTLFLTSCLHLRTEKPIIARKVVYKNLMPGRYEVQADGHSRFIEVVPGKTVELEFEKPTVTPAKLETMPETSPK
jgi:hypothetical protein